MTTPAPSTTPDARPLLRAAQALAVLTVAIVVLLFGTAGVLVQDHEAEGLHGTGAIALHVSSGLLAAVLAVFAWRTGSARVAAGLAVALFGFSFLQAAFGSSGSLDLHVPGAFVVCSVAVGLAVWLLLRRV